MVVNEFITNAKIKLIPVGIHINTLRYILSRACCPIKNHNL